MGWSAIEEEEEQYGVISRKTLSIQSWLSRYSGELLAGRPVFHSRQGQETPFRSVQTGSEAAQPPIQRVSGALSSGIKRPVSEADH
jgi:hypothetical protein